MAGRKRGAGERVLESRHVIGLFLLMLVFSAVFFTLGYVMGRNQYDGQVRAASTQHDVPDAMAKKSDGGSKHAATNSPSTTTPVPEESNPNSDWEFYSADKQKETGDHLKPVSPLVVSSSAKTAPQNNNKLAPAVFEAPKPPQSGGYTLQVMAVRRESDALDLAKRLQKNKFPAFVLTPQGSKYYRVQVGPYSDKKSAEAAKKGLEGAGFRAIVKRG